MSVSYRTYIGAYVRCAVTQSPQTERVETCPTVQCQNHMTPLSTSYCALCGTKRSSLHYSVMRDVIDEYELADSIQERLVVLSGDAYEHWSHSHGIHIWLPNIGNIGIVLDEDDPFLEAEIDAQRIDSDLRTFAAFFAQEIAHFTSAYGSSAVRIHWGVIRDYL